MFKIRVAYELGLGKTRILNSTGDKDTVLAALDTAKLVTGLHGIHGAAVVVTSAKTGRKIRYNYKDSVLDTRWLPAWGY